MTAITASLPVAYDDGLPRPRVIVTFEPLISINPEVIKVRVYPANPDEIVAGDGGSIRIAGNSAVQVTGEIVSFEGTDTGTPEFPITGGFSWERAGVILDENLETTNADFSADPDTGLIRCDKSVVATIQVRYTAGYSIADYIPSADFKSQSIESAYVAARKGATITKLQLESAVYGQTLDYVELWSVTSVVVINVEGRWELPEDWPDAPNYDPLNTQPPDPDESATELRTHDRGVIDNRGRVQRDRPFIRYEEPFVGTSNYDPVWTYSQGSPPPGYETAFQNFDFGELKTELAKLYPDLQGL